MDDGGGVTGRVLVIGRTLVVCYGKIGVNWGKWVLNWEIGAPHIRFASTWEITIFILWYFL